MSLIFFFFFLILNFFSSSFFFFFVFGDWDEGWKKSFSFSFVFIFSFSHHFFPPFSFLFPRLFRSTFFCRSAPVRAPEKVFNEYEGVSPNFTTIFPFSCSLSSSFLFFSVPPSQVLFPEPLPISGISCSF